MHTEYTTDRADGQALTPVDLKDGRPLGYWVKDEQGRVYHKYTEDELPLIDRSPNGRVRPWRERHRAGLLLAEIYVAMAETVGGAAEQETETITLEGVTAYQLDSTGAPVLDANGQPVPEGLATFHTPRVRVKSSPAVWLDKARRLESCAQYVEFARADDGQLSLHTSSFCRVRLCLCANGGAPSNLAHRCAKWWSKQTGSTSPKPVRLGAGSWLRSLCAT